MADNNNYKFQQERYFPYNPTDDGGGDPTEWSPIKNAIQSTNDFHFNEKADLYNLGRFLKLAHPQLDLEDIFNTIKKRHLEELLKRSQLGFESSNNNLQQGLARSWGVPSNQPRALPPTSRDIWM